MVSDGAGGWKVVGVVSWGHACADSKTRGVYAEVPVHEDFVTSYPVIPPSAVKVPVLSGTPRDGETLTCTPGEYVGEAPTSFDYSWYRGASSGPVEGQQQAKIPDAALPTYTLTAQDVGVFVWCDVNASNAGGSSGSSVSNALFVEAKQPPVVDPTPTPTPTAIPQPDTVAPTVSIAQFSCHRRSCTLLIKAQDDSSGVKEVSATLELTYQGRCTRGRKCTRVKVKPLSSDIWTTAFKGYSKPNQRAKVTVSAQDHAGNRVPSPVVATKQLTR